MNAKDFLSEQSDQSIRSLFKEFLRLLEQLKSEHDINFDKLYNSLPDEYHDLVNMADYFDEDRFSMYRKKVLDLGNETIRNQISDIENFEIKFIFNKE